MNADEYTIARVRSFCVSTSLPPIVLRRINLRTELVVMSLEPIRVWEVVDRAVLHKWSVPEFQRGFVWKTTQVRDLAESLWLDYPIGSLLIWHSGERQEERVAVDAVPSQWIVDGQQRATALAILFGRKPYWWATGEGWNTTLSRYDIRFDIHTKEEPYFIIANAAIRRAHGDRYIPLRSLLNLDTAKEADLSRLRELATRVKLQGLCDGMDQLEVFARLDRVRQIRSRDIVAVTIHHDLEDVVEIFARLNGRGTRVTEADIYLGIVASKNPGWVRDSFLPFLDTLRERGFAVDPNLLFRSLSAMGAGKVRFKEIPESFWERAAITRAWAKATKSWGACIHRLAEHGILSDDPLPTKTALVTLIALVSRFPDEAFDPALYWLLEASRFGRYSGSATTALDEDLRSVEKAGSLIDAASEMLARLPIRPLTAEDFLRDYGDSRFGRLMIYLLAYDNGAHDWDAAGHRLGFEAGELMADFRPQWHHIFPRKLLSEQGVEDARADALANIAVIGPTINIRISAQNPMGYLEKYGIGPEKLREQFIEWSREQMGVERYDDFLSARAARLAVAGNAMLSRFACGLPEAINAELAPAAL